MGILVWLPAGLLLAALAVVGLGFSRLRTLAHRVGSFECSLRFTTASATGGPWRSGFGVYQADRIVWWQSRSLSVRARYSWHRDLFTVTGRVPLDHAGRPDLYLVQCRHGQESFDLTMSPEAYSGLASWVESAPPSPRPVVV